MKIKCSICVLISIFFFTSCDKKRVFDDYVSVGDAWQKDSVISFDLPKLNAAKKYDLFVNLRANANYPFSNIFLIVALQKPNGYTKVDTLEYEMAAPDGTLLGDGFSDIKESKLYYKENVAFKGAYRVLIKQAVRENGKIPGVNQLQGITEVGFRIENK